MIEVCNPATYVEEEQAVRQPLIFKGKKVGFLSNGKPNVDLLYDYIARRLPDQFQTGSVYRTMKANAAEPASEEVIKKLCTEAEVVINAIGD